MYISAFTLTAIAGDRFMVIIYPFKPRVSISVCLIAIAVIWIEALVLTIPFGWFMEETYEINNGITYCDEVWPSEQFRKSFVVSTSILQFIIPFALIAYCYIKICYKLRQRTRSKPGIKSARKEEIERERTKRTNRMLISMVLIFGASWLPLNLYNLVQDFYQPASGWLYARAFFLLAHATAMSSTCYNPFLYAWLNETFRKEFKKVLPCFNNEGYCIGTTGHGNGCGDLTGKRKSQNIHSEAGEGGSRRHHHRSGGGNKDDHNFDDTIDYTEPCNGAHETIQLQEQFHDDFDIEGNASVIVNTKTVDIDEDDDVDGEINDGQIVVNANSVPDATSNSNSASNSTAADGSNNPHVVHGNSHSCAF